MKSVSILIDIFVAFAVIYYSKKRWFDARMSIIRSILKLGDRCTRESMKLMSRGVIAFENSPEKEQVSSA